VSEKISDEDIAAMITPLYALSTGMARVVAGKPAVSRLAVLQAVKHAEGIRPSRLAGALNLHQSQVTRQIQTLEDEGLLTVGEDPQDGRSRVLSVTAAGDAEIDRLTAFGLAKWHRFVADWGPDEVRDLGRLLTKLHNSITEAGDRSHRRRS
jgi:DNA-binding MarR family transcriptional regulator